MAKFHGLVGYNEGSKESLSQPGVWLKDVTERSYSGDVLNVGRMLESDEKVNDDLRMSARFSIVADGYAIENFSNILYVVYNGTKWKVNTVTVERPRLILYIGGIYNG